MREEIGQQEGAGQVLLERETELATLEQLVAQALAGQGAIAVIEGPAGIGKSSLVQAMLTHARREGVQTLAAHGSDLERDFPFGIVRQLFEAMLVERPATREHLLSGAAALAAPVFSLPGGRSTAADEVSQAVLHGLHWLTADLARNPLALAVDDGHWSDAPSLRFLAYLANRMGELPLLVIVATRPFEPGAEMELLDEILLSPLASVIRPAPLSTGAIEKIVRSSLAADPEPDFTAACLEATNGNPFFLRELLGTLRAEGIAPTAEAAAHVEEVAPPTVARSVLRRIKRLPAGALSLAQAVAILGGGDELRPAAKLAGLDEEPAAQLAADLERAEIFERGRLEFIHPVVRAAIYAELPPIEQARRHGEAARMLADLGEEDDQVALHLLASEPSGDPWAVTVLRPAAERARARGAPDGAATYLQRALSEPPPPSSRTDVLLELGRAEAASGRPAGLSYIREALELAENPYQRAAIALELAQGLFGVADLHEAANVVEDALTVLDGRAPDLARRLESQLISVSLFDPSVFSRMRGRLSRLLDEAGSGSDPALLAQLAMITVATTEPASRGAELARRALAGGLSVLEQPDLYWFAANALVCADQLEEGREAWDKAIATARRSGSISGLIFASTFRAHAAIRLGLIAEAEADAREALDRIAENVRSTLPFIVSPLIDVLIEQGELEAAAQWAQRSGVDDEPPDQLRFAFLFASVGRLRIAEVRPAQAIALLRECGRLLELLRIRNPGFIEWRSSLAGALAAADQVAEARELAVEEVDLARRFEVPRELGMALRATALVGESEFRLERLREAVSVLEGTPARLEHARVLTDLGAALRRAGHRADSREPLRRGLDLAHRCGAAALVQRARTELLATGARPRRLVLTGLDSLTVSERRVAEMARKGLTNREIAQALFITEKTVEGHLLHVYQKLDISSREELPEALGGVPPG